MRPRQFSAGGSNRSVCVIFTPAGSRTDTLASATALRTVTLATESSISIRCAEFNKKTFVLDTDIVLEAVVSDDTRASGLRSLIGSLIRLGSRVVIPESVLAECVAHAQRSPRTYSYFGQTLLLLTPAVVEQQVWNVFVKGYYYAQVSGRIPAARTYAEYLSNFCDLRSPERFFRDVVRELLPEGVEVVPLERLRHDALTDQEIENFAGHLQADLASSKKSRYRTEEDEASLARTDATLFLTTLRMNPADETAAAEVLGGTCYLVTETARYTRVARSLGVHATVTVRPSALVSVQELIGTFEMSASEFVQLFDNPFLETAVSRVWPDIEKLVRSGVSLRGKSLSRLRFDLDDALHAHVLSLAEAEEVDERASGSTHSSDSEFFGLLETATSRGYSLIPELEALRVRVRSGDQRAHELEAALSEVSTLNEALQERITFFGKRKQRYLRRMNRSALPK